MVLVATLEEVHFGIQAEAAYVQGQELCIIQNLDIRVGLKLIIAGIASRTGRHYFPRAQLLDSLYVPVFEASRVVFVEFDLGARILQIKSTKK